MRRKLNRLLWAGALTLASTGAFAQAGPAREGHPPPHAKHVPGLAPPPVHQVGELRSPPFVPPHFAEKRRKDRGPEGQRADLRVTPEIARLHDSIVDSHTNLIVAEETGDQAAILAMKYRLRRDHAALHAARVELMRKNVKEFEERMHVPKGSPRRHSDPRPATLPACDPATRPRPVEAPRP